MVTIEEFYERLKEGELYGAKCKRCGNISLPPREICPKCFSTENEWYKLPKVGEIESYTFITVAPKNFESEAPYAVCIVKIIDSVKFIGRMKIDDPKEIKIGDKVEFVIEKNGSETWPSWPKIYLKKLS
ncbi:MAG: Zn-ribbon domain-containing OB-fold protein [Thermoproteota archaeon]|jgi:Predicted nucleic-acid-binding protein containing a Zn-ribbon